MKVNLWPSLGLNIVGNIHVATQFNIFVHFNAEFHIFELCFTWNTVECYIYWESGIPPCTSGGSSTTTVLPLLLLLHAQELLYM